MTMTDDITEAAGGTAAPALLPELNGIHHIALTVHDVEASAAWYERVFGLERRFVAPHTDNPGGYTLIMMTPDGRTNLGLAHHESTGDDVFSPARLGLDHACFHAPSLAALRGWADRLDALGIEHTGAYRMGESPVWLLQLRDPDGIALELIAFDS